MEENLSVLFRQLMEARLERVHTWLPAKIVEFDHKKLRATVQPTVKKVVGPAGKEIKLPYPLLFEVPVDVIKTEHFLIRPPYAKDDPVTLGFYERSLSFIIRDLEQRDPTYSRKHHLTDAIIVQGRMTDKEGDTKPAPDCWVDQWILVHRDKPGTALRFLPSGAIVVQVDPSSKIYLGQGSEGCEPGDVAIDGAILGTRHKMWADSHTHSGVVPGGGVTGPPTVPSPDVSKHVMVGK